MTNREIGVTPFGGGRRVSWSREDASADEVLRLLDRTAAMIFRVRTLVERPDGSGTVTTYAVPGDLLDTWLSDLRSGDDGGLRVVLNVEVI